jgi:hemerythrin-like metal-binding protein
MSTAAVRTGAIAWSSSLEVGVRVIDAQHMRLVAMINNLHDAVLFGGGRREAIRILEELLGYTQHHFAMEERLMEQHAYPGLSVHRREHATLAAGVQEFQRRYESGGTQDSQELQEFLRGWLVHHLMGPDRHLGAFLVKQGVR